MVEQQ